MEGFRFTNVIPTRMLLNGLEGQETTTKGHGMMGRNVLFVLMTMMMTIGYQRQRKQQEYQKHHWDFESGVTPKRDGSFRRRMVVAVTVGGGSRHHKNVVCL